MQMLPESWKNPYNDNTWQKAKEIQQPPFYMYNGNVQKNIFNVICIHSGN